MVANRTNDRVAVVAYDGLTTFEFAIPLEVFGLERPEIDDYYEMVVAAGEPGPLRATFGLSIHPDGGLELVRSAGTVIVAGWRDRTETPPSPLLNALVDAHDDGARLVSICSGAYVLAATGLLDGRRATTHWRYIADLQRRYPRVMVSADELFVDEGTLLTSAGSAAGIDTCLHLVRHDWGATIANVIARRLVVSALRDGGQAQHIPTAPLPHVGADLAHTLALVEGDLSAPHTVGSMAASANMSVRTFQRRFRASLGLPVSDWLAKRRLDRARELLEHSDLPVERIACDVGYSGAVGLRHQFRTRLHTTPTAYRSRFRTGGRGGSPPSDACDAPAS